MHICGWKYAINSKGNERIQTHTHTHTHKAAMVLKHQHIFNFASMNSDMGRRIYVAAIE